MNPVLSLFFFLGLADALKRGASPVARWLVLWGAFFLVPGFLSLNMDGNRVVQVLPLVIVLTASGFRTLMERLPLRGKWTLVGAVLLFTLVFDLARLWGPHLHPEGIPRGLREMGKSLVRYKAFEALLETSRKEGPGIVLGEWDLPADRTLQMASYPFNAAQNPDFDAREARWLAVLADIRFKPFLERRFPKGRWKVLGEDPSGPGDQVLCILPMEAYRESLWRWAEADRAFAALNWAIDHLHHRDCLGRLDQGIREHYPLIQGDPFLEACYWEKVGSFYYYYGGHFQEHLRTAQLAVERGYPASHLYFNLAGLWKIAGEDAKVQEALRKARESGARYRH